MKHCRICGIEKQLSEFGKNKTAKDKLRSECKCCYNKMRRNTYHKNKGSEQTKKNKIYRLKTRYGITLDDFNTMVKKQNGRCSVCNKETELNVEHNHNLSKGDEGFIRGLLCSNCNRGIGLLGDNIENLKSAVKYLEAM